MTPQQVLDHFGTQAEIARVLGCKQPSVAEWFDKDEVPEGRQYQLELATAGALKAAKPANRNPVDEPVATERAKASAAPSTASLVLRSSLHREPRQDAHRDKPTFRKGR
jgi:hypothetical protein